MDFISVNRDKQNPLLFSTFSHGTRLKMSALFRAVICKKLTLNDRLHYSVMMNKPVSFLLTYFQPFQNSYYKYLTIMSS